MKKLLITSFVIAILRIISYKRIIVFQILYLIICDNYLSKFKKFLIVLQYQLVK